MNFLVVEDEPLAAERLAGLLERYATDSTVVGLADSVKSAAEWLERNPVPDLVFLDIHLGDGLSFEIFERTTVACPVIFTTAYQEYALKAFKVNSIDYLLKPIDREELFAALDRFQSRRPEAAATVPSVELLQQVVQMMNHQYKSRFMVKRGEHLAAIATEDVLFFFSEDKITWLKTAEGKRYALDLTLEQLELLLDPRHFFRVNRQYIIGFKAIADAVAYSNSRLKLKLRHAENADDDPLLVSRDRVSDFKRWLDS